MEKQIVSFSQYSLFPFLVTFHGILRVKDFSLQFLPFFMSSRRKQFLNFTYTSSLCLFLELNIEEQFSIQAFCASQLFTSFNFFLLAFCLSHFSYTNFFQAFCVLQFFNSFNFFQAFCVERTLASSPGKRTCSALIATRPFVQR